MIFLHGIRSMGITTGGWTTDEDGLTPDFQNEYPDEANGSGHFAANGESNTDDDASIFGQFRDEQNVEQPGYREEASYQEEVNYEDDPNSHEAESHGYSISQSIIASLQSEREDVQSADDEWDRGQSHEESSHTDESYDAQSARHDSLLADDPVEESEDIAPPNLGQRFCGNRFRKRYL